MKKRIANLLFFLHPLLPFRSQSAFSGQAGNPCLPSLEPQNSAISEEKKKIRQRNDADLSRVKYAILPPNLIEFRACLCVKMRKWERGERERERKSVRYWNLHISRLIFPGILFLPSFLLLRVNLYRVFLRALWLWLKSPHTRFVYGFQQ